MSKNGKLLFRGYDPYITSSFGYRIHPVTKKKTLHAGVDYGTNNKKMPTYAIEDGEVVKTGYSQISGNFVYVNFKRLGKNAIYQHLDRILVKNNQKVNSNTIIGYTGTTGESTGIHLHFGWFNSNEQNKGWYERNWEDFEKYEYKSPIIYFGNPVKRDTNVSQIEVLIDNLRVRKTPNGEILGYIKKGIYNILENKKNGNYTWYKIEDSKWIAYDKEFANLYLKEEKEEKKEEKEDKLEKATEKNQGEGKKEETEEKKEEKSSLATKIFQGIRQFVKKILKFFHIL